jgi:hypothetical protein
MTFTRRVIALAPAYINRQIYALVAAKASVFASVDLAATGRPKPSHPS